MSTVTSRAGPEILGTINDLRRISIIWGPKIVFFTNLGAGPIYIKKIPKILGTQDDCFIRLGP